MKTHNVKKLLAIPEVEGGSGKVEFGVVKAAMESRSEREQTRSVRCG